MNKFNCIHFFLDSIYKWTYFFWISSIVLNFLDSILSLIYGIYIIYHFYMVFVFLCLFTSLSMTIFKSIYVAANSIILLILWLSNIVYMSHISFIHSSVDGHVGCFHVLAIVNSASVNFRVHVPFWIMVFSVCVP